MKTESAFSHRPQSNSISRRDFFWRSGGGLGGIALLSLLGRQDGWGQASPDLTSHVALHHPPRADRVIQLFMAGAASHLDTFDYKPELIRLHGKPSDFGEKVEAFQDGLGPWMKSPWEFKPYGQCGKFLSDIVAPLGACVDDMAFIHNLTGKTGVHSQATYLQATGFQLPGFPGVGNWVSYALGSINENLPDFVVMPDHRGYASNGPKNWSPAFLPAEHAGTVVYPGDKEPMANLFPASPFITPTSERASQGLLQRMNRQHLSQHPGDSRLEARIRSYELAARMQLSAPEAFDLSKESTKLKEAYGIRENVKQWPQAINTAEEAHFMGVKCLTARRLVERGVRFVQIWSGNDNSFPRRNWDSHENIQQDHEPLALGMATAVAALILDLKQRGLLDRTLVLWTTEFGRMPSTQGSGGRDHNPHVFTNWLCGGGIRGGITHGPSDEWGFKPLDRNHPTEVYDIHATLLHQLGMDHTRLTFRHNGIDRRLTDVHGRILREII